MVESTKEDVKMSRIKLKKDKSGDLHINGYSYQAFICRRGFAKFFGIRIMDIENEVDLVVSKRKTKDSFEVTADTYMGIDWGSYVTSSTLKLSRLYIDGKDYGLTSDMANIIWNASDKADKFYIRVEV